MVSRHIAIVAHVTPIGFCMDGSAVPILILHGLGHCLIETILHGDDHHVLLGGRYQIRHNLSVSIRKMRSERGNSNDNDHLVPPQSFTLKSAERVSFQPWEVLDLKAGLHA